MLPEIADAIATGRDLIDQFEEDLLAANIQRSLEEKAELEAAWAPGLAAVVAATPAWAHQFIQTPNTMPSLVEDSYFRMYRPVVIDVSNVGRIYAYFITESESVLFVPVKWKVQETEHGYEVTPATRQNLFPSERYLYGNAEFPIALAYAYAFYQEVKRLEGEAETLNEQARQRAEELEAKRREPTLYQRSVAWLGSAEFEYEAGDNLGAIATALMSLVCILQDREGAK